MPSIGRQSINALREKYEKDKRRSKEEMPSDFDID
jgi:hypothetical protein